jgi:hypothetical protein
MRPRPLLALVALALAACGKVASPVPPETRVPAIAASLSGSVGAGAIELRWIDPDRRVDQSPLRDLVTARVFRAGDDAAGDPPSALLARGTVPGYAEIARIDVRPEAPGTPGAVVRGTRVSYTDTRDLSYGRRYTYVVLAEDAQGRSSAPSARLSLVYVPVPEPPRGLRAIAGEREVRLEWETPAGLVDGSPLPADVVYEVLRAPSPEAEPVVVTRTPVTELHLTDENLENDRAYHYRVRAARRAGEALARGEPTAAVAATPRDMTAPSPPTNLVAVPTGRDVRLVWSASPDPDVAGYIVYRARAGGDFERVGSVRAPVTTFVDRDVAPGPHRYAVVAFDSGAQPNESARSVEATVTAP